MRGLAGVIGLVALSAVLVVAAPAGAQEDCANYACAEYLQHDLDNYSRARGRTIAEGTSPAYHQAFVGACADSQARALAKQVEDLENGRLYGGVGQATCWWSVGDAAAYNQVRPRRFSFLARTGAKLQGHVWDNGARGRRPGVVITTGSIQASDQMYWWAARALAARGYVVMTYDVQGQGQSETFGHAPGDPAPTTENVPSQQSPNFFDGTIDALRFFLSTKGKPYVPVGWSQEDLEAARSASDGDELSWVSPARGVVDRKRFAVVGHSLGASAISGVQQCSDEAELWKTLELCAGRSYPIRAAVAWDALGSDVTPVVPAMSQNSDGYFLFPTTSPTAPDAADHLAAYETWDEAGLDVFSYTVRGGTHIEWSQVPYTAATTYGAPMNAYYTLAWLDRWVHKSAKRRAAAYRALTEGPKADPATGPGAANYFSTRRYSAATLSDLDGEPAVRTTDLRAWAGRSAVGDWAGSNADRAGRVLP